MELSTTCHFTTGLMESPENRLVLDLDEQGRDRAGEDNLKTPNPPPFLTIACSSLYMYLTASAWRLPWLDESTQSLGSPCFSTPGDF